MRKPYRQEPPQGFHGPVFVIGGFVLILAIYVLSIVIVLGTVILIGATRFLPVSVEPALEPIVATIPMIEIPTLQPISTFIPVVVASPTPLVVPTCTLKVVVTSSDRARIRNGPGLEYSVTDIANPSEVFNFEAYNGDNTWIRIGIDRWIYADLLSVPRCV